MNTKLLLFAVAVAAFSSCTTLYKSGQTPDDVYFSPARPAGGYVEDRRDEQPRYQSSAYQSEYRTIRLGINDPRWRYLDNNYSSDLYINDYSYSPYNYGYNYGYYYNPFYYPYPVYNVYGYGYGSGSGYVKNLSPTVSTPRTTNLSAYNPAYNNIRPGAGTNGGIRPVRTYSNSGRGSAVGNVMRQIFTPSNNNANSNYNNNNSNNNNNSSNNRTYTPAASSSSSSAGSSSSGGGGAISRPPRN